MSLDEFVSILLRPPKPLAHRAPDFSPTPFHVPPFRQMTLCNNCGPLILIAEHSIQVAQSRKVPEASQLLAIGQSIASTKSATFESRIHLVAVE